MMESHALDVAGTTRDPDDVPFESDPTIMRAAAGRGHIESQRSRYVPDAKG